MLLQNPLTAGQYKLVVPFEAYREGPTKSKFDASSKAKPEPADLPRDETTSPQLPPQIFSGVCSLAL